MSIWRGHRFLFLMSGALGLAVGMQGAGGAARPMDEAATRPASAPTLAQIDWRKGFTLHQPRAYAVLVQTRLRQPADRWPQPGLTARGILTLTLMDRKEDGSCLFNCRVQVVDGMTGGKSIPPPPAGRFSFSISPAGQPLIDRQVVQRALNPTGQWGPSAAMASIIASGLEVICYPLPPAPAAKAGEALQWEGNLFADLMHLNWRATGSEGLLHVEGQAASGDAGWRNFISQKDRITLLGNHLLYGTSEAMAFGQGEISSLTRLEVYPLPPQTHPTTNPAAPSTSPAER